MGERLQKILSAAGLGSRRACEQIILDGRVQVNGKPVSELPVLVEQDDRISVDGRPIHGEKKVYFLLHKPRGVLVTNNDPAGRTLAVDLLPGVRERVFPVGRLDADSSGLLLLTNDGELSNRLTHPRYEVPKTYDVMVEGNLTGEKIERLLAGVYLSEGKARADRIRIIKRSHKETWLAVTLGEGRNRQVRRMLAKLGNKVRRLSRVSMGKLTLRGVGVGRFRPLTSAEVNYLRRITGLLGELPALPSSPPPRGATGRPGQRGPSLGRPRGRRGDRGHR